MNFNPRDDVFSRINNPCAKRFWVNCRFTVIHQHIHCLILPWQDYSNYEITCDQRRWTCAKGRSRTSRYRVQEGEILHPNGWKILGNPMIRNFGSTFHTSKSLRHPSVLSFLATSTFPQCLGLWIRCHMSCTPWISLVMQPAAALGLSLQKGVAAKW